METEQTVNNLADAEDVPQPGVGCDSHLHPRAWHWPLQENMSKSTQTKKQAQAKARKRLEREAASIARHFGHPIGFDAMYWAARKFEPTAKSFDEEGHLTCDAEHEFLLIMGENWDNVFENVAGHVCQITRSELNIMRAQQGLPPV